MVNYLVPAIIGMLVGGGLSFFFGAIAALIILFFRMRNTHLIMVRHQMERGQFTERLVGRPMIHPQLGEVYYIPSLKKTKREYIPQFGKHYETPCKNGQQRWLVYLSARDNVYAPEVTDVMHKVKAKRIEQQKSSDGKISFKIIEEEKEMPIIRPVSQSMRQFHLFNDSSINQEYKADKSWMERYGLWIGGVIFLLISLTLSVLMIVFAMNAASDLPTMEAFADTIAKTTARELYNLTSTNSSNVPPKIELPYIGVPSEATP